MEHPLSRLLDEYFKRAEKRGEFKDLAGSGKPLKNMKNAKDAVLDRLMKESRVVPAPVALKRDIAEAYKRLAELTDETDRKAEMKKLADLQTRLAIELEFYQRHG